MARKTQIVMGGEENYELLQKKEASWWSCGKETKEGELLLIYLIKPISAIVAMATTSSGAKPRKAWRFGADIKNIKIIEPPITLSEIRQQIPEWRWAKSARRATYLNETKVINKLLKLANLKRRKSPEKIISSAGAGFGTPEQNRVVEKAACKAVRHDFENRGYKFESREKENLGYDFDANRNGEKLHVEVKGISGAVAKFIITANELKLARTDLQFRVAAVTEALTAHPKIHHFTGRGFLKKFGLIPLAYFAEMKPKFSA